MYNTFLMKLGAARGLLVMLMVIGLGACASGPRTTANADPSVDFSRFKTFGFIDAPGTDGERYESLETNYLKASTTRELERRGFRQSDSPDMLINFSLETQEKVRSRTVPTGGYVGAYDPFYDVYYDGWGATHTTRIDQYTEGKLNIDVINPDARKLMWQGTAAGRITQKDLENAEEVLDAAVVEIFKNFPVGAGS